MTMLDPTPQVDDSTVPATHDSLEALWDRLVRIRWDSMSQSEMARRLHVVPSAINKMENHVRIPQIHNMLRYARVLGYEVRITLRKRP